MSCRVGLCMPSWCKYKAKRFFQSRRQGVRDKHSHRCDSWRVQLYPCHDLRQGHHRCRHPRLGDVRHRRHGGRYRRHPATHRTKAENRPCTHGRTVDHDTRRCGGSGHLLCHRHRFNGSRVMSGNKVQQVRLAISNTLMIQLFNIRLSKISLGSWQIIYKYCRMMRSASC
jgi:hypothetical protein